MNIKRWIAVIALILTLLLSASCAEVLQSPYYSEQAQQPEYVASSEQQSRNDETLPEEPAEPDCITFQEYLAEDEYDEERYYEDEHVSRFADYPHGTIAEYFLEYLNDNLPERVSFSYRELEVALWIAEQLELMGYDREHIKIQEFTIAAAGLSSRTRNPLHFFDTGNAQLRQYSQNVILTVPGQSEQKIIVGAHYDSFFYPSASDNASGTALSMESAARMRYLDNYFTIVYVFFGAEEVGLIGAYYYLHSLSEEEAENIVLMISADCLFDGSVMVYAAAYDTAGRFGTNALTAQIDGIANRVIYENHFELTASPRGVLIVSDHMPFFDMGHTVMVLFSADVVDGRFRMRVFHSPRDDIHYINERWPGRIQTALLTFSVFLEEVLLMGEIN
jgi:hypothetical protein